MNGLYGKTIQRPILDENVIIHLHEEFIKYGGVSMRAPSDGSFYLTYQDKESLHQRFQNLLSGKFILGYSRRIMLEYLKKSNPYFNSGVLKEQLENYTDTDSIQIHAKNMKGFVMDNEIGGISDDLRENCKICMEDELPQSSIS
jgi:hypothetical protein